jgi:mRNA interferase MazF
MDILRGDIFFIQKFDRYQDNEVIQSEGRPAVIVSNNLHNEFSGLLEVVYLTSQEKKPIPSHVPVLCKVPSTALCEQIDTVSKERLGNYVRKCTDEEMAAIDKALMYSLGIEQPEVTMDAKSILNDCNVEALKEEIVKLQAERDTYMKCFQVVLQKGEV